MRTSRPRIGPRRQASVRVVSIRRLNVRSVLILALAMALVIHVRFGVDVELLAEIAEIRGDRQDAPSSLRFG